MSRTLGVILCVLLAVQLVAADTAFSRRSAMTKLAARIKAKSKMVAPTVLGSGETADSHGVEPVYSFIAEHSSIQKKQHTQKAKTTLAPVGAAPSRVQTDDAAAPADDLPAEPQKSVDVKTVQLAEASQAKAEEKKVEQTVQAAETEEGKLVTALAAVKAEEKKDDPAYQNPAAANAQPAAAAPAAQSAAETAAEEEIGKEQEEVVDAEKKVEAEESAVSDAVKQEEEVKAEVEKDEAAATPAADCCKQPADVTVGPKFIPADETRSVLLVGNHEQNAEKYEAVATDPKLLTDPTELKSIDEASQQTGDDIAEIGKKVDEISKAPLVENPESDTITA